MNEEELSVLIIKSFLSQLKNSEQAKLDSWLKESEKNTQTYLRIKANWEQSRSFDEIDFPRVGQAMEHVKLKISGTEYKHPGRWFPPMLKIAALIVLAMSLGAALFKIQDGRKPDFQSYTSGNSPVEIVLPDSSCIWLGRNSTLYYPEEFSGRKRQVVLEGLAYFQVKENSELPFVVKTDNVFTEVCGTSFTVECMKSGDVDVILESGSVIMYKNFLKMGSLTLSPGESGLYSKGGKSLYRSLNENPNFLSWKTRKLSFYDTPLHNLCADLSRCYGVQVQPVREDTVLRYTGSFSEESLEDVIRIIELTLGTRIMVENPL